MYYYCFLRRGVMILINKDLSNITEIKKVYKDINNRVLVLKLKNENFEILVGNIYAPAEGKKVNKVWLKNISKILLKLKIDNKCNLILGGDWNVNLLSPPTFFLDFCRKLSLNDIMRAKFDYENITTHTMKIKGKKKEKKLDAWLYDRNLSNKVNNYWVNEFLNINSDHKPIYLDISFQIDRYQKNKINDELLDFISNIRNIVKLMKEEDWHEYKNLIDNLIDLNELELNNCFNNIENNIEINNNFNKIVEVLNKIMIEGLLKTKLGNKLNKNKKQNYKKRRCDKGKNKKKKKENKLNLQIYRDKLLKLRKITRKKINNIELSKNNKKF